MTPTTTPPSPVHGPLLCGTCKTWEQATHFRWRSNGERKGCMVTHNASKQAWLKTPKGRQLRKRSQTQHRYGLTRKQQETLFATHTECQACGRTDNLVIDHCHDTGVVRGRLCNPCNTALGYAYDDADRLRKLAEYVEMNHPTPWYS